MTIVRHIPEDARHYLPLEPIHHFRQSVREPVNPKIMIPLLEISPETPGVTGAMDLNVPQIFELIMGLTKAANEFCRRGDIRLALLSTTPGLHV